MRIQIAIVFAIIGGFLLGSFSSTDFAEGANPFLDSILLAVTGNSDKLDSVETRLINIESSLGILCGNGFLEVDEQCDDGIENSDSIPDACRTSCENPSCGDAVVDTGESCDDGNESNLDSCLTSCIDNVCGDGFVNSSVEQCDDGNTIDDDACSNSCVEDLNWELPNEPA